jgi:hypothetical protein
MAIATSPLHRGFRGGTGDFIFRNYNGKTVVSLRPVYRNETNTEARRKARDHFREAAFAAQSAMERPDQRSYFMQKARQLKLPNAYTAAITDYLRRAKVRAITRSSFSPRKGAEFYFVISKYPFRATRLEVQIYDNRGTILAEQTLTRTFDQTAFRFTLLDDLPDLASMKITTDELGDKEYVIGLADIVSMEELTARRWKEVRN